MRLLCKIFETLKINEESHLIKKCVGVINQYVTKIMCTLLILRHVSADCAFSIWECLRPEKVTNIYNFLLQIAIGFHVLLY